jgi:hypothetical protein
MSRFATPLLGSLGAVTIAPGAIFTPAPDTTGY